MTDTTNPFDSATDDDLAVQLQRLADRPRTLSPERRAQLLAAAAHRLLTDTEPARIDLGGGFTFAPKPRVGDLRHDAARDGVFLADVTEDDARKVADKLNELEWWQPGDGA